MLERRHELERNRVFRAIFDAVEADEAFALAQLRVGIRSALAVFQAQVAIDAFGGVPFDSPKSCGGDRAKESAQGADNAAEKTRDYHVHSDQEKEHKPDHPSTDMIVLPHINGRGGDKIDHGQNGGGE